VTCTVVGIVKDVPVTTLSQLEPVVYQSLQTPGLLLVRERGASVVDRVAAIARSIEPKATVTARPLADDIASATAGVAVAGRVAWGIALFALILAAVGAAGVFAYTVEERRREIGVRVALGAQPRQVVWTVVTAASGPLLYGIAGGLLMASLAAPVLRRFLYGLSPFDPTAYLGVCMILVAAAMLATWAPARRAARIDPAVTLRAD
jgi:ABC-type lipoprotein release transport system permease subunit